MTRVLEPFGDAAWRVTLTPDGDRRALLGRLRRVPGVLDAVVTEEHALVTFDPNSPASGDAVRAAIDAPSASEPPAEAPREHVIRARYDGPDLEAVASLSGLSPAEVVRVHAGATYVVAAMGFQPGFGYLRGLDPRLQVPRRATPRPRVPALSLAIAGPYAGIYPFASPGGWNLLGHVVGFTPFDARAGAALALGDVVRFTPQDR